MSDYERGEEITLEGGDKYVVVDNFEYKGKNYLYLISEGEDHDVALVTINDDVIEGSFHEGHARSFDLNNTFLCYFTGLCHWLF